MASLGTYKAWGFLRKHILGLGPDSLVPLMHLPKARSCQPCKEFAAMQELCFLRAKLPRGGVGGTCTEPPELTWAQQNDHIFIFPSAFCLLPKRLSLLRNGLTQAAGTASWGQPLAGNVEREGRREGQKTLKPLLSSKAEASVDYKPECPVKESRGCSLYLQQHHRQSGEGRNRHEEKKAPRFVTPAITAEGCKPYHTRYNGCLHLSITFPRKFLFNH